MSNEQRDLVAEANEIKQEIATSSSGDTPKVNASYDVNFTTLAKSAVPNLNAYRILTKPFTKYVPDFFFIIERLQLLFEMLKANKVLSKNPYATIQSFTLYIAYQLMYNYLEIMKSHGNTTQEMNDVLDIMKGCGYDKLKLPSLANYWLTGLGRYTDPSTKRVFDPRIPNIETFGNYFNEFFYSSNTGHLLPHFRGMFAITCLFDLDTPIVIPPNSRTSSHLIGADYNNIAVLNGTIHARRNYTNIPGLSRMTDKFRNGRLTTLIYAKLMNNVHINEFARYMMIDHDILRHLKMAMSDVWMHIDVITLDAVSNIGDSLTTIPMIYERQSELKAAVDTPATQDVAAQGRNPAILGSLAVKIPARYDHKFKVKSRVEIVNGHVDIAYQTPLIRLVQKENAVIIGNHIFVEPNDNWYTIEHEFETPPLDLIAIGSYFTQE